MRIERRPLCMGISSVLTRCYLMLPGTCISHTCLLYIRHNWLSTNYYSLFSWCSECGLWHQRFECAARQSCSNGLAFSHSDGTLNDHLLNCLYECPSVWDFSNIGIAFQRGSCSTCPWWGLAFSPTWKWPSFSMVWWLDKLPSIVAIRLWRVGQYLVYI